MFDAAFAMHEQGQLDQAEAIYKEILQSQPQHFDALQLLATIAAQRMNSAAAVELFEQALRINPDHASSLNNRGNALLDLKRHEEALQSYGRALEIEPDYAEAHYNRGNALADLKRHEQALESYELALHNRGYAIVDLKRHEEALASYDRALEIKPDYAEALYNRGNALHVLKRAEEAVESYDRALRIKPDYADALYNRGNVLLLDLKRLEEALESYERALEIKPDYAEVHLNRAIVWLLLGDFQRGWPEYEWRWKCAGSSLPRISQPRWSGEPLHGRTILLRWDQGLGDTLQFVRYARLFRRQGARVIVSCQKPLVRLLRRCEGVDELVAEGEPLPDFDFWTPMLSIPGVLRTNQESIPGECGYLSADPALVARWKTRLADFPGFRIAIAWQGSPDHQADRQRSIPLRFFAQLAQVPGVRLINLRKGPGAGQLAEIAGSFELIQFEDLDTSSGPFMDTAAIMRNVDLTVSCDTSVVHLAGALGVPVWLAQTYLSDWRWFLDRDDSPWYPSLRLFRQQALGDWHGVFQRIALALRERLDTRIGRPRVDEAASAAGDVRAGQGCMSMAAIAVEVSAGELIDKITILEIKSERIADADQLRNVRSELAALVATRDRAVPASAELAALTRALKQVNESLWRIEDDIRDCERQKNFGAPFVALARSVYKTNDPRAALKRQINELLGSRLIEEKSYAPY